MQYHYDVTNLNNTGSHWDTDYQLLVTEYSKRLEKIGIPVKVYDVDPIYDYQTIGARREDPEPRFVSEMNVQQVENLLSTVSSIDYLESFTKLQSKQISDLNDKINKFKAVLSENTGFQEQWDEFLIALKLAGFDEDLFD